VSCRAPDTGSPCGEPLHSHGTGRPCSSSLCFGPEGAVALSGSRDRDLIVYYGDGPVAYDLYVFQGDDHRRRVQWLDLAGAPVADLTGCAAKLQVRADPGFADDTDGFLFQLMVGSGIAVVDGPNAVVEFVMTAAQTALLAGNKPGRYDLAVTPAGGDRTTLLRGRVLFDLQVTR
jgi:hypothetical protein